MTALRRETGQARRVYALLPGICLLLALAVAFGSRSVLMIFIERFSDTIRLVVPVWPDR